MKINKAYKFRIYPTNKQIQYIEGCFNACRYVYNVSLDCEKQLYTLGAKSNLSPFSLAYHLKYYKIGSPWLKNYDAHALAYEMENLAGAFKKFFTGYKTGAGFPRFKSKNEPVQSFRTRIIGANIKLNEKGLKIPKIDDYIEIVQHREVEGKIKQVTITRKNGKYYTSIMTEINKDIPLVDIKKEVGVDMGLTHFMILDDGTKIDNPKFLDSSKVYMKILQRKFAKAKKGSNNHIKLKKQIAKLHEKISEKRKLFLHEESKKLIDNFDRIYIEDLNVKGMSASSKGTIENPGSMVKQKSGLNRNILDTGLGGFTDILKYKAKFSGKEVVKVGRFFASSKICSNCGDKNKELKLIDRLWVCTNCGAEHDRDINAAKNIKAEGRRSLINV